MRGLGLDIHGFLGDTVVKGTMMEKETERAKEMGMNLARELKQASAKGTRKDAGLVAWFASKRLS
jgi:hypothetical protein